MGTWRTCSLARGRWTRSACARIFRRGDALGAFDFISRSAAGEEAGGPGPLEVEATDAAVAIEDFAGEVEVGRLARLHGAVVDLAQGDAAGGDFGVVPATMRDDRE